MLPQRIVRASALRSGMTAARLLPTIQRRTFLPASYTDKKVIDAKYPDGPSLTEAEDPGMVSEGPAKPLKEPRADR